MLLIFNILSSPSPHSPVNKRVLTPSIQIMVLIKIWVYFHFDVQSVGCKNNYNLTIEDEII